MTVNPYLSTGCKCLLAHPSIHRGTLGSRQIRLLLPGSVLGGVRGSAEGPTG